MMEDGAAWAAVRGVGLGCSGLYGMVGVPKCDDSLSFVQDVEQRG